MSLRLFILHNFWLKILSLVLACGIWLTISDYKSAQSLFGSRFPTLELRCPVTVMVSPNSRSVVTVEPNGVIVKVRAEDAVLKKLTPENIQAYVRLPDVPNLSHPFRVEVIVPPEVTLKEVVPDQVSLRWAGSTNN